MTYDRIVRYVLETPWAIRPEALGAIIEVLSIRAAGGRFTDDELLERLEASRQRAQGLGGARQSGAVAVVPLYGSIFPRANLFTEMSGGTSLEKFAATLRRLDADDKVSHIVLDVASPGGSVELVPETAEIIRGASTPITAVANAEAASAAYWLASQADHLVVTPSGMVGSIGVWTAHEDWSRHDGNLGVSTTLISAGRFKVEGNPFEPLGDDARSAMQSVVDEYYDMFVADVAAGRGTTADRVRSGFAEGRMVTARDALERGMVDRVAPIDAVLGDLVGGTVVSQPLAQSPGPELETLVADAARILARPAVRQAFAPDQTHQPPPAANRKEQP